MRIRPGDGSDLDSIMALGDEAVAWMVSRGNTEQWGTLPWSANPARLERMRGILAEGDLWVAELDGEPVGVLIVSDKPDPHIPPAGEPEVYVRLLLTSRRHAGKKIGSQLLDKAVSVARERGVSLVRVDCYRGEDGELVGYYERNGYVKSETFMVKEWPGQVLTRRI
ncbi:GNAT family N-acetyltransferase [Kibdelosporangium phytohabitans]|uniref:GCN5 family acetyltransferase n=1 Tax=Kibdelosporangium phytohabitans TaxID=860235 RepID=A0A0N9HVE7_9PSEU|nr:GNAT family N-acetyltransferase [Kibdelosporangium phytohabitans]ALG07515.1 GCN5 family acetyltransferase [Kibdelosporangium phytohabitans]MBE1471565.1 GNAT superfamily N-acetyltransferase [Kibdelosporangium phytohabitans]